MTIDNIITQYGFKENTYTLFKYENVEEYYNEKFYLQIFTLNDYYRLCLKNKFTTWTEEKEVQHIHGLNNLNFYLTKHL